MWVSFFIGFTFNKLGVASKAVPYPIDNADLVALGINTLRGIHCSSSGSTTPSRSAM